LIFKGKKIKKVLQSKWLPKYILCDILQEALNLVYQRNAPTSIEKTGQSLVLKNEKENWTLRAISKLFYENCETRTLELPT
jgi:hypothetical protein